MTGKILKNGEGGHGKDLLFAHETHGPVIELIGVIDGRDARLRSIERAWLTRGMHGDATAQAGGLLYRGDQLRFRVLVRRRKLSVAQGIGAGFVYLGEVRAFFILLAHDRH